MLQIGTLVDNKYKIIKQLGQGGMGIVWLALNERLNRLVAIKEIQRAGTKQDEIVLQNFRNEFDILKHLNHPGLPMIFDVIDTNNTFLMIMTYIEGETLSQLLKKQGPQPQNLVIDWCKQLCDILEYLHNRVPPVIYGDMKPANIMLQSDGRLMLIDFGIAGILGSKRALPIITKGYAAPEQYSAGNPIDVRADIYALGVTLHQLITGVEPPKSPNDFKPVRQYNSALSAQLEHIIEKCMQINPNHRFQSISELKNDLAACDKEMTSCKFHKLYGNDFLRIATHLWHHLLRIRYLSGTGEKKDKRKDKVAMTESIVKENPDAIYYNAELLMRLYSDEDEEIRGTVL